MKQLLVFCILAIYSASASTLLGSSLRVRFGVGRNHFYTLPQTVSEAVNELWTETDRPDGPLASLVLYCHESRIVCTLYDDTDNVAGLQVAFPEDEFQDAVFDWEINGFTKWTPSGDSKSYWTIQQYFVSEEYLATSKDVRMATRISREILPLDGIWLTGINRELVKVSKDYEEIDDSIFTRQACIPLMGRHYYYNMTSSLPCNAETLFPWFPLVHSGELVATGLVVFGKFPEAEHHDWFERPTRTAVELIVPRGPDCLYDLADNPSMVTMHIYYVSRPALLTCLLQ